MDAWAIDAFLVMFGIASVIAAIGILVAGIRGNPVP